MEAFVANNENVSARELEGLRVESDLRATEAFRTNSDDVPVGVLVDLRVEQHTRAIEAISCTGTAPPRNGGISHQQ